MSAKKTEKAERAAFDPQPVLALIAGIQADLDRLKGLVEQAAPKFDPANPQNKTADGKLSEEGVECCYRMFDEGQRDRLTTRIAGVLGDARKEVQMLQLCHFFRADRDYGMRIAKKLNIDVEAAMTQATRDTAHAGA